MKALRILKISLRQAAGRMPVFSGGGKIRMLSVSAILSIQMCIPIIRDAIYSEAGRNWRPKGGGLF